jgi:hypothetical protein
VRRIASVAGALLAVVAASVQADEVGAAPPPPSGLEVKDGDGWRSETRFPVTWSSAPADPPLVSAHYLLRDEGGSVVSGPDEVGLAPGQHMIELSVPSLSGVYDAGVWLEDSAGAEGAPATVKLRLDLEPPSFARPLPPSGWISRNELPYTLRLTQPTGPAPLSGIRGYAISVDREAEGSPCKGTDRCSDAETDLRDGIGGDSIVLGDLPEGRSFVHAVAVSGSGMRSATPGHEALRVDRTDPLTRLSGAPAGWADRPVTLEATATDSASGMAATEDSAPFTAIRIDGGAPVVSAGPSTLATVIGNGVHTVAYYARDAAGNVSDGGSANGHPNAPPSRLEVRIDRDPPVVAFTGSADPREPELIEARVVDALSGHDAARGVIAVRRAGSDDRFEPLPTGGRGETLRAHWRSEDYPEGEYEFRVTGYDVAGNATSSTRRLDGSPMLLPNPLKPRTLLTARVSAFSRYARRKRHSTGAAMTVGPGHAVMVAGRLTATSDLSPSHLPIRIFERFDPRGPMRTQATGVETDDQGRFRLRLAPGPSREV